MTPTPEQVETMRREFEKWAKGRGCGWKSCVRYGEDEVPHYGNYRDFDTEIAWRSWQTAYAAGLAAGAAQEREACAMVCESIASAEQNIAIGAAIEQCAYTIRARAAARSGG